MKYHYSKTCGTVMLVLLSLILCLVLGFSGCGPVDPPMKDVVYEAQIPQHQITIQCKSAEVINVFGKSEPLFNAVRFITKDNFVYQLAIPDDGSDSWRLYFVPQGRAVVEIPLRLVGEGGSGYWPKPKPMGSSTSKSDKMGGTVNKSAKE